MALFHWTIELTSQHVIASGIALLVLVALGAWFAYRHECRRTVVKEKPPEGSGVHKSSRHAAT